ncbi:MAG: ABC transporter substrate-binding protein [Pirellulales bacterium]
MRATLFCLILFTLSSVGCKDPVPEPAVVDNNLPISLVVIDDAHLAQTISREWLAQSDQPLEVKNLSVEELWAQKRLEADAIIYPPQLLGELVHRKWIEPIPKSVHDNEVLTESDFFSLIRRYEIRWDKQLYALPLGSPAIVFMYREDIFEELELAPPTTWEEYQVCVETITEAQPKLTQFPNMQSATLEPLAPGWKANTLIARTAAYAKHRDNLSILFNFASMESNLHQPAFIQAAEDLKAVEQTIPDELKELTPAEIGNAFLEGKSAMALGWFTRSKQKDLDRVTLPINIVQVPGSRVIFNQIQADWVPHNSGKAISVPVISSSGLVASITSRAVNTRSTALCLIRLTGSELGFPLSQESEKTTLCRNSTVPLMSNWLDHRFTTELAGKYGKALSRQLNGNQTITALKIPSHQEYMQSLETAVGQLLEEETSAADALKSVSDQWNQITDRIGKDQQKRAFAESLNF